MKVRIRSVRWAACLLLTSLFVNLGCGDPQYGVVSKPRESTGSNTAQAKPWTRKDLPKNQYRPEDQKSDKLRAE